MKIIISNIGKIKKAEIKLDGMTVIAGGNNTGKSTVGKALFSSFNGLYQLDTEVVNVRKENIYRVIRKLLKGGFDDDAFYFETFNFEKYYNEEMGKIIDSIIKKKGMSKEDSKELNRLLTNNFRKPDVSLDFTDKYSKESESFSEFSEASLNSFENYIQPALDISDEEITHRILNSNLQKEFDGQINNIHNNNIGSIE
jgi:hypothetical protein